MISMVVTEGGVLVIVMIMLWIHILFMLFFNHILMGYLKVIQI